MSKIDARRATTLGNLVKEARLIARRSLEECAAVVGITSQTFTQIEDGTYPISLPELEALAIYLKVPMGYFWGSDQLNSQADPQFSDFINLRHRVVGVLLRQLRLRARKSVEELAESLQVDVSVIEQYETGHAAIPFLHLEQLSRLLDVSVVHFTDDERGPLGRHEQSNSCINNLLVFLLTCRRLFLNRGTLVIWRQHTN